MVLPRMTRGSIVLRALCGLCIVAAVLTAGATLRSPWIVAPLGVSFAVLFVIGKWHAWTHAYEQLGWRSIPMGIVTTLVTQCGIVALLYGVGFAVGVLFSADRTVGAYGPGDLRYAAWTLAIGGALAILAHVAELRAGPDDDYFRSMVEGDPELSDSLREAVLHELDGNGSGDDG